MKKILLSTTLLLCLLSACNTTASPPPTAIASTVTTAATSTPVAPTVVTATPVPTATPTLDPMTIQAMRAGSYPGSPIVIDKELDRGIGYRRYYAHYLSQGLKIYGLLTIPNGDPPPGGWPGIVFNHGYIPPDVYRTTERYVAYVDRIARAGYVVYKVDYRGHDQSEGQARGAYGDPGYEVDVLNAIASLQHYPVVNPDKIGMWGHSMGGYLTLRAMVISKAIKVGVIWGGVVASYPDMLYNWHHASVATPVPGSVNWHNRWIGQYGTPEQNPAFWDSISATSYLADLSGPLQLHHSVTDEEVPVDFSIRLAELGREAGQTVELYTYEDDNHNISQHFSQAMDRTIAFFDRYLK